MARVGGRWPGQLRRYAPTSPPPRRLLMPRDYFAEMYVAGILADNGWNIYFPRRDKGFDFIITKPIGNEIIVRPVQVKGKYPEVEGRNLPAYGYGGKLSQLHDDMVLAIAYFSTNIHSVAPDHVAYMP